MVQLVARKKLGRIAEGATFSVGRGQARLLLALKHADLAPDDGEGDGGDDVDRKALTAEGEPVKRKRGRPRKVVQGPPPAPDAVPDLPPLEDDPPDVSHDESTDESRPVRSYRRRDLTPEE